MEHAALIKSEDQDRSPAVRHPALSKTRDLVQGGPPSRVLIVDDEQVIREILSDFLLMEGFQVATAGNGREALEVIERQRINMVISDLKMPEMGGLDLLAHLQVEHPDLVTLVMTGYGTVETAIEAMKLGAFDYVLKPFKVEEVMHTVRRGLEQQRLKAENFELRAALSLYRLANRLGTEVELEPTLSLIVETVKEQTEAQRVCVVLFPTEDTHWPGAFVGSGAPITQADLTELGLSTTEAVLAHEGRAFRYLKTTDNTRKVNSLLVGPLVSKACLLGVIIATRCTSRFFNEGDRKLLRIIADRAAVAVHNAQLFETQDRTFHSTIEALATALEEKDRYTAGHSQRVAEFAEITARELGRTAEECEWVYQGGRLHDIGKMTIRADELNKPGPLTDEEYKRFQEHPKFGEELLSPIPSFRQLIPAIGGHHEKWDGSGYPRGLVGEDIHWMARIMAVADTYDAMTSHRAYRSALKHKTAVAELERCAGTQFDPEVVPAFVVAIEKWRTKRAAEGRDYPR